MFVRFEVFKAHSGSQCRPRDQCGDCGAVFETKNELSVSCWNEMEFLKFLVGSGVEDGGPGHIF